MLKFIKKTTLFHLLLLTHLLPALPAMGNAEVDNIVVTENNYNSGDIGLHLIQPKEKPPITLDTIKLINNAGYSATNGIESIDSNLVNNSSQIAFKGYLLDGSYELRTDTRSYNDRMFSFGGFGGVYHKDLEDNYFEVGEVSGIKLNQISVASRLLGFQTGKINKFNYNIKALSGKASPDSQINVYINDKYNSTLPTESGFYNLSQITLPERKVYKLKIEEISREGEVKELEHINYPFANGLAPDSTISYTVLTGVTGYNNRLFSNYNSFNDFVAKKYALAGELSYGLTNRLTLSTTGVMDNIITIPNKSNLIRRLPLNPSTTNLLLSTYRDFNPIEGQSGIASFKYMPKDRLLLGANIGISHANNTINNPIYEIADFGYISDFSVKYDAKKWGLNTLLYNYSPNFYLAGTSGLASSSTGYYDRFGGQIGGNTKFKNVFLDGSFNKYYSNINDRLPGGKFDYYNYNLSGTINLPHFLESSLSVKYNDRIGENNLSDIFNRTFESTYYSKLNNNLSFNMLGKIYNSGANSVNTSSDGSYESSLKMLSSDFEYDLPKRLGALSFIHDIVKSGDKLTNNDFNAVRLGYTLPVIKKISTIGEVGYHYTGENKSFDFSLGLGYLFDSGRKFDVSYNYNRQIGSFLDEFYIPSSSRHSININLSDTISLVGKKIRSIGNSDEDCGFIEVITFIDSNQNGIKDKGEMPVPDINISLENINDKAKTDEKGEYYSKPVCEGFYKVKINSEIYNLSGHKQYLAQVSKRQKTTVYFGIIDKQG